MSMTGSRMVRRAAVLLTVVILSGVAGCSSPASTDGGTSSPTAGAGTTSRAGNSPVAPEAFAALVDDPETVVLDVRTEQEYAEGHLKGAELIDLQAADFPQRIAELDKDATYAVYCRTGRRSAAAVQLMQQSGFTEVSDLDGGITAWAAQGREIVTG
jgi:rhodanese-related sulfurtransferase